MKIDFTTSLGKSFPTAGIVLGYLLSSFGTLGLIQSAISFWSSGFQATLLIPLILTLIGIFLAFSSEVVQFNFKSQKYRRTTKLLGYSSGKWHDLNLLPYLAILKNNTTQESTSRGLVTLKQRETFFDIYLLSSSHRKKVLIERMEDLENCQIRINELSTILRRTTVSFNPKLSEQTKQRRRKRKR